METASTTSSEAGFDTDSGVSDATNFQKNGEVNKNDQSSRGSSYHKQTCTVATQCNIPYIRASNQCDVATQYDMFFTISRSVQCNIKCENPVKKLSGADVCEKFQDECACCHQVFERSNLTFLKTNKPKSQISGNFERKVKERKTRKRNKFMNVASEQTICQSLSGSSSQEPFSDEILSETVTVPDKNFSQDCSENVITETRTSISLEGKCSENIETTKKHYKTTENSESEKLQRDPGCRERSNTLPPVELADKTEYCRSWLETISKSSSEALNEETSSEQSDVSASITSSMDTVLINSKNKHSPAKNQKDTNASCSESKFGESNKSKNLPLDLQSKCSSSVSKGRKSSHKQISSGLCDAESYGISECESSGSEKQRLSKKRKTYRLYTRPEQIEILKFIIKNNYFHRVTTKSLWVELAMSGILEGRSWESIRNHFRNTIGPNIRRFNLGRDIEKKFPPLKKYY